MRTNIVLDDSLVEEAFALTGIRTKKDLVHLALEELVRRRRKKDLLSLAGRIRFADGNRAGSSGGSSTTTWAFTPPSPNELTPARRGPLVRGHGIALSETKKGVSSKRMRRFGACRLRCGGIWPAARASSDLINPAMPAADSR